MDSNNKKESRIYSQRPSEITLERSKELAEHIEHMKLILNMMDRQYIQDVATAIANDANRMDSMAALSTAYSPIKTDLMRQQAVALKALGDFIDALKECDRQRQNLEKIQGMRATIDRQFL